MNKGNKHLLIIGYVWPEPNSSAAGRRMMNLISLFQSNNWEITFATAAAESAHRTDLEKWGILTEKIAVNDSGFDDFVEQLNPDAVLFDRFVTEEQFGWRVAEQCPSAIRILDTEDLHCLRRARGKAVKEDRIFHKNDLLAEKSAKREIASIYRCDLSLIISDYEMDLLKSFFGVSKEILQYLPFRVNEITEKDREVLPDFEDRNGFMTIGNFRHEPNWDSVCYLREEIWPHIREDLPNAEMYIYGAYMHQQAEQLHDPENGFLVKGRADDSSEVMKSARICLAPLRFGAGLKGKLLEAMLNGTPSVTTEVGAEGLKGDMKWGGAVEDNPAGIAEKAVELYSNKEKWKNAQNYGSQLINSRFATKRYQEEFMDSVDTVRHKLQEHRLHNFTGQMLLHHTTASSKYMARWIEAKNR